MSEEGSEGGVSGYPPNPKTSVIVLAELFGLLSDMH